MRIKALLALLGLGLALMLVAGCSDENESTGTVTGTVTNSSTGLGQGSALVTLQRNGTTVATTPVSTTVGSVGQYTFGNIATGAGYTVVVSSTATPAEFTTVTSPTFTVTTGTNTHNVSVGTGITSTISGTVTNASTGLGQGNATVALLLNGTSIATQAVSDTAGSVGQYTFTGITPGPNYALQVTSNATPAEFTQVTTPTFTATAGANTQNVTVGTGVAGVSVSGSIGTINATDTFVVKAVQGTTVLASTTAGPADTPTFTLTNVPVSNGITIQVLDNQTGIITVFGPVNVPAAGLTGLWVYTKTAAQLLADGVPANGNVVAYIAGGGTIMVNGATSVLGNPTYLANVATGNQTVTINPPSGTAVQLVVPVSSTPVVIRYNPTP